MEKEEMQRELAEPEYSDLRILRPFGKQPSLYAPHVREIDLDPPFADSIILSVIKMFQKCIHPNSPLNSKHAFPAYGFRIEMRDHERQGDSPPSPSLNTPKMTRR